MNKYIFLLFLPLCSFARIQIAATTTDVAAIVREVGGDQVEVFSIAKGTQDPHQIEAKPSYMVKLRSVDLVFAQGLELETAWLTPLIEGSRNEKLVQKNNVMELAPLVDPIDIPQGAISRADGDVHPGGNPHFQLDPIRVGKAALLIADRLSQQNPAQKAFFSENAKKFNQRMIDKTAEWKKRLAKIGIKEVVTYHKYLAYFCSRFDLICARQLEPKPGIPPTANHLMSIISEIKKRNIGLVLIENLYLDDAGKKLKQDIPNLKIQKIPVSVEGDTGILTNEQLIEKIVSTIEASI
jgi:zinc/manganese transport system substrate-binding protein